MTSKVFLAVRVPADPARAFEAFTQEIATWWRPNGLFRITPRGDGRLGFEPGVGGRLCTTLDDGEQFEIGRISVWEPGHRLVFAWRQASFAPDQATETEVCFEPVGDENPRLHRAPRLGHDSATTRRPSRVPRIRDACACGRLVARLARCIP